MESYSIDPCGEGLWEDKDPVDGVTLKSHSPEGLRECTCLSSAALSRFAGMLLCGLSLGSDPLRPQSSTRRTEPKAGRREEEERGFWELLL